MKEPTNITAYQTYILMANALEACIYDKRPFSYYSARYARYILDYFD